MRNPVPQGDDRRALPAGTRLTQDGVDAWLDKAKLLPGQDWELEIRKAVRETDVVVICLSKKFAQKGYRQKEVQIALGEAGLQPEGEIFIIPARLEECNVPQSLQRWHWVDLFEPNGFSILEKSLKLRADKLENVYKLDNLPMINRKDSDLYQKLLQDAKDYPGVEVMDDELYEKLFGWGNKKKE